MQTVSVGECTVHEHTTIVYAKWRNSRNDVRLPPAVQAATVRCGGQGSKHARTSIKGECPRLGVGGCFGCVAKRACCSCALAENSSGEACATSACRLECELLIFGVIILCCVIRCLLHGWPPAACFAKQGTLLFRRLFGRVCFRRWGQLGRTERAGIGVAEGRRARIRFLSTPAKRRARRA